MNSRNPFKIHRGRRVLRVLGCATLLLIPICLWPCAAAQDPEGSTAQLSESDLEALEAIGYLGGYEAIPERIGVVHHDPARAMPGYNLYISGHAPEAYLADMGGVIQHTWTFDASALYPIRSERNYWRRVHLAADGVLYAVCDPHGILKLDRDSKLLWHSDGQELAHHDLFVAETGDIYALGKDIRVRPAIHESITLIDDVILRFDREGRAATRFPMLQAYRESHRGEAMIARVKQFIARQQGEYAESFHTNTIEVMDGSLAPISPLLKRGNILGCSPTQSTVWIMDGDTGAIVWSWSHNWGQIHQPTFLPNGNWLLFHNSGYQNQSGEWRSQVLEYDFPGCTVQWAYRGHRDRPETEFYSGTSSLADRLPNGNTLITVSESGRAIEVTQDKSVVWEFYNPKQTGAGEARIATLFQLERIPADFCDAWLDAVGTSP